MMKAVVGCVLLLETLTFFSAAQVPAPHTSESHPGLVIVVSDENGVAISAARVSLQGPKETLRCHTDNAGRCQFPDLSSEPWQLRVEKETYYLVSLSPVQTHGDV